jgi:hypothetical protein
MADKKISALTAASTPLAGTEVLPIVQSGATVKVSVDNLTAGKTVPANAVIVGGGTLSSWGSNSPVEVGTNGTALSEQSSGSGLLTWNLYQNSGGNFVYKTSNPGLLHQLGNDGVYRWYTAPSGTAGNTASITLRASLGLTSGDYTLSTGNLIQGTAAKGINFTANTPAAGMTSQLLNWYETGTWTPSVSALSGTITTVGSVIATYTRVGNLVTLNAYIPISNNGTGAGALVIGSLPFTPSTTISIYSGQGLNDTTAKSLTVYCQSNNLYVRYYDATYPVASGQVAVITICYPV